jgi:Flp pilus assembly protein TadD
MIMTDAGFAAIETSSQGPLFRVMSWLGLAPRTDRQSLAAALPSGGYSQPAMTTQPAPRHASHEPARLAESYAFLALVSARNGGYAEAESYFREAFTLDRTLAPTTLTNFWQLPRQAHEAAGRALIAAGRDDEAVDLVREIADRAQPHLQRAAS